MSGGAAGAVGVVGVAGGVGAGPCGTTTGAATVIVRVIVRETLSLSVTRSETS